MRMEMYVGVTFAPEVQSTLRNLVLYKVIPACVAAQEYKSPTELWSNTKDADGTHETWYKKAVQYWDQQEASYDGVLGGYGHVSDADVADSRQLLLKVQACIVWTGCISWTLSA